MSTLAETKARDLCCERIAKLSPHAPAQWGRMNVHQMVCHLNDAFRMALGQKSASSDSNLFKRTIVKWVAIHTPLSWPKGYKTRPEMEQGLGGTPPVEWERDRADLRRLLLEFAGRQTEVEHPVFGKMSQTEWLIWGYRHTDHHLRQFGV